jgi:hypothetical protein
MDNDEKAREVRLRNKAQRHGQVLRRSRSRSTDAPEYGKYRLYSVSKSRRIEHPATGWLTLDQIETELAR